jgi:hypothetical protein
MLVNPLELLLLILAGRFVDVQPDGDVSQGGFALDGRTLLREGIVIAGLDVAYVAVDVLVASVDAIQLLLEVLVDELVPVEQFVQPRNGRVGHVITVTIHII